MAIWMCEFDKLDKTFAFDLFLIYKRSPSARVCISDKDQLLMFFLPRKHCLKVSNISVKSSLIRYYRLPYHNLNASQNCGQSHSVTDACENIAVRAIFMITLLVREALFQR